METQFKIGDVVQYKDVDMEYYSRGYGINYETKTAQIVSICYKLSNGETVEEKKLVKKEPLPSGEPSLTARPETWPSETQKPLSNGQ
jgi:hypothetical protein